jgi:hypothetical protein
LIRTACPACSAATGLAASRIACRSVEVMGAARPADDSKSAKSRLTFRRISNRLTFELSGRLPTAQPAVKLSARTRGWAPGSGSQLHLPTTRTLPLVFARTLPARGWPDNYAFAGQTHALATAAGSLARTHRPTVACGPLNAANG